jgi:RimJ/RimL family protein N-acetyltransferase
VELLTERLRLRPFTAEDLPMFVAYRARPEVAAYQGWNEDFAMADAEEFFAEQRKVSFGQPGAWMQLAIEDRDNGALCGDCAVHLRDDQPGMAELGITLSPDHQGRGIANEALAAVVDRLFSEEKLHRIYAETDDRNEAVHRVFERLGFRCEARLVEADWFKEEWTTVRVFALLRREWAENDKAGP